MKLQTLLEVRTGGSRNVTQDEMKAVGDFLQRYLGRPAVEKNIGNKALAFMKQNFAELPTRSAAAYQNVFAQLYTGSKGRVPPNYVRVNRGGESKGKVPEAIFNPTFEVMRYANDHMNVPYSTFKTNAEQARIRFMLELAESIAATPSSDAVVPNEFAMGPERAWWNLSRAIKGMRRADTLTDAQYKNLVANKNKIIARLMVHGKPKRNLMKWIDQYRGSDMQTPGRIRKGRSKV